MAGAYGADACVTTLERSLTLDHSGVLTLTDRILLTDEKPVCWVFMLRSRPDIADGQARFGRLALAFDPALEAKVEEMPVTDARMARNFPGSLWRLTLRAPAAITHKQTFLITRS